MLIDIPWKCPESRNPYMSAFEVKDGSLCVKAKGLDPAKPDEEVTVFEAERIQQGVYSAHGLDYMINDYSDFHYVIRGAKWDELPRGSDGRIIFDELGWFSSYGIADDLEQILAWKDSGFVRSERKFALCVIEAHRETAGFRWHKEGPYIGTRERNGAEYFKDDLLDKVILFRFIEVEPKVVP